ncbi:MAG TPA: iron ABC transporter permease [Anaerolineaceae bacterium]|nr:iron ABC transporter permease [Anaerolineaceae bacterium]
MNITVKQGNSNIETVRGGNPRRFWAWMSVFLIAFALVFLLDLSYGSLKIPVGYILRILSGGQTDKPIWHEIVLNIRLTKAVTAVLVGSGLAIAGLLMQTFFRNPLADPFILGINSGASLGVALAILSLGTAGSLFLTQINVLGDLGVAAAAILGASLVFGLVMLVSRTVKSSNTLLILGLMFGSATSALVSLLIYFSIPERIQAYMIWTYGSFGGVTWNQLRVMAPVMIAGIVISSLLGKRLNALLLGEDYAKSLGLNISQTRFLILFGASILAGTATAFCGPIGFLGVAIPHIARNLLRTSNHRYLLPSVLILGAVAALLADVLTQLPGTAFILPINVITSLFGAPFVLWIILRRKAGSGVSI